MTLQGCNNELRKGRMGRMFEQLERFIEDNSEEILITGGWDDNKIFELETKLEDDTSTAENTSDMLDAAKFYHDTVLKDMYDLRLVVDKAEEYIPDDILPYPNYEKLLFYI